MASQAKAAATASFNKWLDEALPRGAGKAHRFAKQDVTPGPVSDLGTPHRNYIPIQAMCTRAEAWGKLWNLQGDTRQKHVECNAWLQRRAREQPELPPIYLEEVQRGLLAFKNRARGADFWTKAEVMHLPEPALAELAGI